MLDQVGVADVGPRTARAQVRKAAREAQRPLVRADRELRAMSVAWLAVGIACVLAAVLLGSLERLTPLESVATVIAIFFPPLAALATAMLGRRTPTRMVYRLILDRAPAPPPGQDPEPWRQTALRAGAAALLLGLGMLPVIGGGLAVELAAMGKPRAEIPEHLAEAASLIDGVWLLACAASAAVVARWIVRWEQARGRAALCPPLHAGLLSPVYFATGGRRPRPLPEDDPERAMPPPAPPSRGTGAGRARLWT